MDINTIPKEKDEEIGSSGSEEEVELKWRVWVESKKLWRTAFPAMLTKMTQFGAFVVTQAFIGHIGQLHLAAYALVQIITIRFAQGMLLGMSSATETLCGQAYGAKQYHMMGIYLQRSWIITLATATLILPLFIFPAQIFKLLGEKEDISNAATDISLWFIPFLYNMVFNLTIQKYLQTQLKNVFVGWLSAISFLLHVLLSWVFVSKLNWGITGAMAAMTISSWFVVIGDFIYVFGGWCPQTWTGFAFAAFSDLIPLLKISIASGFMLCFELWYYAVLILLAGYMKNAKTAISAFSICINVVSWDAMLCLGFMSAATVRVANELGRGDAKAAKFAIKVNLCTSVSIGVVLCIVCLAVGNKIAYLFGSEEEVTEYMSTLYVLLAFSVLLNSVQSTLSGVAIGAGMQAKAAYVNISCYYAVGVPVGVALGYAAHLQVKGIWIGMVLGVVLQSLALCYMTINTDWDDQVKKSLARLNRFLKSAEECNADAGRDG